MAALQIVPDREYRGKGISEGLARGLLVFVSGENLTGEGMGIGSVAIRNDERTIFSRTRTDTGDIRTGMTRTYFIDTGMAWGFRGQVSPLLTKLIESAVSMYMHHPRLQGLLMGPVMPLRNLLSIHPVFEAVPRVAEVRVTYRVTGSDIDIRVIVHPCSRLTGTVCILNELAGDRFVAGWNDGRIPPPPGWEEIPFRFPTCSLIDPDRGVRFWIRDVTSSPDLPVALFWGREQGGDLSWAGFSLEIGPLDTGRELEFEYSVGFEEGNGVIL